MITPQFFSALPERFRRADEHTAWADANRGGAAVDCFLEGPAFDRAGNLYVVDIPFGRIFRIAPSGEWTLAVEYVSCSIERKSSCSSQLHMTESHHDAVLRATMPHRGRDPFEICRLGGFGLHAEPVIAAQRMRCETP